jgi:hypothetical protein
MTDEQRDQLKQFAAQHGRNWKSKLRELWMRGADANEPSGHLLRQVRNQVGPSGLDKVDLED